MKLTAGIKGAWRHVVPATKKDIQRILMKVSEVEAFVKQVDDGVQAMSTEVSKIAIEVQALKDSLGDVEIPAGAQTALDNLSTHATAVATALKAVDDIIPDNPTPTP